MMKNNLKITRVHANASLYELASILSSGYKDKYYADVAVNIDRKCPVSYGKTGDGLLDKEHSITVGSYGLADGISPFVSNLQFGLCMITMFHENRHMSNYLNHYVNCRDNIKDDVYLTCSYLACQTNQQYYLYDDNYYNNPVEIDAEQVGIFNAYNYLCYLYPGKINECEQLIVSCVNHKAQNFTYYVKIPEGGFISVDEINKSFNDAFECSKTKQRMYHMWVNSSDEIMTTISYVEHNLRKCKPEWDSIWTKMCNEHDGLKKDMMMSCIMNALHPDYKDMLPRLTSVDLSPDAVFGEPFPDSFYESSSKNSQSSSRSLPPEFEELYQKDLRISDNNQYYSI